MCFLIWPRTVGRKPWECHRVKRECHRILPNGKSSPSIKRVQNGLLVNRCLRDWPALFVRSVQSVDGRAEIIYLWLVFSITTQEKHLMQSIATLVSTCIIKLYLQAGFTLCTDWALLSKIYWRFPECLTNQLETICKIIGSRSNIDHCRAENGNWRNR